jgi:hypothetical protein
MRPIIYKAHIIESVLYCREHDHKPGALRVVAGHPVLDPDAAVEALNEGPDEVKA